MFYIAFSDKDHAQIGLARSKDGITAWKRHPANPIVRPDKGQDGAIPEAWSFRLIQIRSGKYTNRCRRIAYVEATQSRP